MSSALEQPKGKAKYAARAWLTLRLFIIAFALLTVILPFMWVLRAATRTHAGYLKYPAGFGGGFTLHNFEAAWQAGAMGPAFLHTLIAVPTGALLATVVAALAGFGFAKLDMPLRKTLLGIVITGIAVPLPAVIIPLLEVGLRWHYANSYAGLIFAFGAFGAPWATFFFYSYFKSIPDTLVDAARIDGCTEIGLFRRIGLPLARPALATVIVLEILGAWANLLLPLVLLPDPTKQMLIVNVLSLAGQYDSGGPVEVAALLILVAPILFLFACSQRFLRAGIFGGAVKG